MPITLGRRELIAALGGAAMTWPLAAHAQQPAIPVIGYMDTASASTTAHLVEAFRRGLSAMRAPKCLGSAAMAIMVSAEALNRMS